MVAMQPSSWMGELIGTVYKLEYPLGGPFFFWHRMNSIFQVFRIDDPDRDERQLHPT